MKDITTLFTLSNWLFIHANADALLSPPNISDIPTVANRRPLRLISTFSMFLSYSALPPPRTPPVSLFFTLHKLLGATLNTRRSNALQESSKQAAIMPKARQRKGQGCISYTGTAKHTSCRGDVSVIFSRAPDAEYFDVKVIVRVEGVLCRVATNLWTR